MTNISLDKYVTLFGALLDTNLGTFWVTAFELNTSKTQCFDSFWESKRIHSGIHFGVTFGTPRKLYA